VLEISSIAPLAGYGWLEGQGETTRTEMNKINVNTLFPHGVDALRGNVTAPVVTTQAEDSAPTDASVEKESNPQRTEMQENQGGDLRQTDSAEPGRPGYHRAGKEEQ
jgi:hypothetical protein